MKLPVLLLIILILFSCNHQEGEYVCTPCDLPCDEQTFTEPGICPHCQMALLKKSELGKEIALVLNEQSIKEGVGAFLLEGGSRKRDKKIQVHYYQPTSFGPASKILLVIPGAGRNGDSYRDAWIPAAEKYGVLILSPQYAQEDYPFEDYHLGGVMYDLNLSNSIEYVENSNRVILDEQKFEYKVNDHPEEWIFNDFDRIFNLVVEATHSTQEGYDIFGHSAGGQILHRLAIFQKASKANNIIAANAGFYTLLSSTTDLPFGIKNAPLKEENVQYALRKKLTLLIGELDNENETGGTLLRSTTADQQGLHRLARAKYFYHQARAIAEEKGLECNWELKIIPGVGHNHEKMGKAAADFLYEEKTQ